MICQGKNYGDGGFEKQKKQPILYNFPFTYNDLSDAV